MYLSVIKVKPLIDYELELTFENKEKKIFDVKPYLDTGLFRKLKNENVFNMVKVSYDTIEWPYGIDLDPEVLYEKSRIAKNISVLKQVQTSSNKR